MTGPVRVSVIVPVFNEVKGIPLLAERLAKLREMLLPRYELECVMVDDGSSDGSRAAVDSYFAHEPKVVKVSHTRNRGLGAAMRTGFEHASGEIVCTIDSDCTYDPTELPLLLEALEQQSADIATGSPYHPQGQVENVVAWRLFLSKGASWLYQKISSRELYTFTSLMRAYRRRVVKSISFESDGFVAVAEILLRAMYENFSVVEVPMILRPRATGASKMKVMHTLLKHVDLMSRALAWRVFHIRPLPARLHPKQDLTQ